MNTYWMMTGDWGTMPMNRRGPSARGPSARGKHYDLIVYDDVTRVELPLCWNWADFARTGPSPDRAEQVFGGSDRALAKVRGRTATEAAMEASESLRRLEGVEAAKQEMAYQMKKMQRIAAEQEAQLLLGRCPQGCIGSRKKRLVGDEVEFSCGHRWNWAHGEKPPG